MRVKSLIARGCNDTCVIHVKTRASTRNLRAPCCLLTTASRNVDHGRSYCRRVSSWSLPIDRFVVFSCATGSIKGNVPSRHRVICNEFHDPHSRRFDGCYEEEIAIAHSRNAHTCRGTKWNLCWSYASSARDALYTEEEFIVITKPLKGRSSLFQTRVSRFDVTIPLIL